MEQLFEFIKSLSIRDKKSLLGKGMKVAEESGELAKVILPYENSYATTHRFVTDKRILEEAVDTILAAISLPYSLGFTTEDIVEMMQEKSNYWMLLQGAEDKITYPLPYEIHVTVKKPDDIQLYKETCSKVGVKPIVLDLENYKEASIDVMTSSVFYGDNRGAYEETNRISNELKNAGYEVIRKKIETVPFHPAAPSNKTAQQKMPEGCYFESHLSVIISNDPRNELLMDIARNHNAHLSRNFFKKITEGKYIKMVTLRKYEGTYELFRHDLDLLKRDLTSYLFEFEKEIVEFSIYDTKVSHDFKWLNREEAIS